MNNLKSEIKHLLILLFICLYGCKSKQECPEKINVLPMYGGVEKCEQQIDNDNDFILESEQQFKSKKEASEYYVSKGWEHYYANNHDVSMKRFNQAWLLDEKNPEVYWGFGNLLGKNSEFEKSITYFLTSIEIEPGNAKVYESISTSYGQLFLKTKNVDYLDLTIENLKKAIKIDPKNGRIHGQLAASYSYFIQKDSLRNYIKLTDEIDPKFINPEIRKILEEE